MIEPEKLVLSTLIGSAHHGHISYFLASLLFIMTILLVDPCGLCFPSQGAEHSYHITWRFTPEIVLTTIAYTFTNESAPRYTSINLSSPSSSSLVFFVAFLP
jgi:hypothetical protein